MIQAHSDAQAVPTPMIECLHHDYLRQQCGRFTNLYTWSELVRLYRLTSPPAPNFPPRYNVAPSQEPFSFAGLWESWRPKDAGKVETLTILTCAPNEFMARIHNRMPVMLAQDAWATWLGETDSTPEQRLAPAISVRQDDLVASVAARRQREKHGRWSARCRKQRNETVALL